MQISLETRYTHVNLSKSTGDWKSYLWTIFYFYFFFNYRHFTGKRMHKWWVDLEGKVSVLWENIRLALRCSFVEVLHRTRKSFLGVLWPFPEQLAYQILSSVFFFLFLFQYPHCNEKQIVQAEIFNVNASKDPTVRISVMPLIMRQLAASTLPGQTLLIIL